jgi:hypothetical protein
VAVVIEHAVFEAEGMVDDLPVRRPALVPAWREGARREGAVREVQIGRAGVLVHAERNLEQAVLRARERELLVPDPRFAPRLDGELRADRREHRRRG